MNSKTILCLILSIFLRFLLNSVEVFAPDYTNTSRTIQFDVKPLLNARMITTWSNGNLVCWNKGVDGTWSGLATRSAADLNMSTRTTSDELYLDVIIDDGSPVFLKVPKGEGSVVLVKGLKAGEHKLAIHKRVESAVGILEVVSMK